MSNKIYELYITTNLITGNVYGGKHTYITKRGKYLGSGFRLKRAIIKYGFENFKVKILRLKIQDDNDLNKRENRLIRLLKYLYKDRCYNLHEGGNGGSLYKYLTPEERLIVNSNISKGKKEQYSKGCTVKQIAGRVQQKITIKDTIYNNTEYREKMLVRQKVKGVTLSNRIQQRGLTIGEQKRNRNLKLYGQRQYTFNIKYPNGSVVTETNSSKRFKLKYNTDDSLFSTLIREGYFKINKRNINTKHNFPASTEFIIIDK